MLTKRCKSFSVSLAPCRATSTKGLAFECKWNNTTPNTVMFGESFNDEMCFVWQYYYPSQGFALCVNGFCNQTP